MSEIKHHPRHETLADFAAGRLDEARAVVVATHAAVCPECAREINRLETLAGSMLDDVAPIAMADDALERVLQKADATANIILPPQRQDEPTSLEGRIPLSAYLNGSIDDVQWKPVAPGIAQSVIEAEGYRKGVLRLLKIAPGTKMLEHSHRGEELTLILRGAYRDNIGEFKVGDLADLTGEHCHEPEAAGDEPCICLIATSAPLEFKSWLGRVAQPFVGL